jgi:hydroxyacylglutathione hydrolase
MFVEKVHSAYLGHISYILGHGGEAAVIDPRRDCGVYVDMARAQGCAITRIFETHRNEDYVTGSRELARRTGATIHHGRALDFHFGEPVAEGDAFTMGDMRLEVLETPGHTYESISLVLTDTASGEDPVAVFTGDALFIGDVGRTDFFPDRKEEVAALLYDSIFKKLLPLGDHVIVYPAHGAGSVCGSGMAEREFSTLGHERRNNPALQAADKEAFVARKASESPFQPPYFRMMEKLNKEGSEPMPMDAAAFMDAMDNAMAVVDVRSPESFAGAFVPGSLAIPLHMLPGYAGYFLDYEHDIGLVLESHEQVDEAVRHLRRLGFDRVAGYLAEGMHAWEVTGREYDRIRSVHVTELVRRIKEREDFTLLDVRKPEEWEQGRLPGAKHIFLGELRDRLDELDRSRPVTTFCGSGQRAVIAASILKRAGFHTVEDALGSMSACASLGCPVEA